MVIVYRPYDDTLAGYHGYTIEVNIFQDFEAFLLYNLCNARYSVYNTRYTQVVDGKWQKEMMGKEETFSVSASKENISWKIM